MRPRDRDRVPARRDGPGLGPGGRHPARPGAARAQVLPKVPGPPGQAYKVYLHTPASVVRGGAVRSGVDACAALDGLPRHPHCSDDAHGHPLHAQRHEREAGDPGSPVPPQGLVQAGHAGAGDGPPPRPRHAESGHPQEDPGGVRGAHFHPKRGGGGAVPQEGDREEPGPGDGERGRVPPAAHPGGAQLCHPVPGGGRERGTRTDGLPGRRQRPLRR
mmetsp:Transcript_28854/g.80676  ORF Transcript_28854/g.80676 Transcript_28854/m.80676 type:complete len:217 (-) Transcript_28854:1804-2454(-)